MEYSVYFFIVQSPSNMNIALFILLITISLGKAEWHYTTPKPPCSEATSGSFTYDGIKILGNQSFLGCTNLLHLDISYNEIQEILNTAFDKLINLTFLDLSRNKLEFIENNTFLALSRLKYLNISNNNLSRLDSRAFSNLESLLHLDLSANVLPQDYHSLPRAVFSSLKNLRSLLMKHNPTNSMAYPHMTYSSLLKLEELYIPGIKNISFDYGFRNLTRLRKLVVDCRYDNTFSRSIDNRSFWAISAVTALSIQRCNIVSIQSSSFQDLRNLREINIACNPIGFKKASDAINSIASANLTLVVMDNVVDIDYDTTIALTSEYFNRTLYESVKYLSLRDNLIDDLDWSAVFYLRYVRYHSLGYNSPASKILDRDTINYFKLFFLALAFYTSKIQTLDISFYGPVDRTTFSEKYCDNKQELLENEDFFRKPPDYMKVGQSKEALANIIPTSYGVERYLPERYLNKMVPPSLEFVYGDNWSGHWYEKAGLPGPFGEANRMKLLNMSFVAIKNWNFGCPFLNMNYMEVMDFTGCGIQTIYVLDLFSHLPSLTHLFLGNNELSVMDGEDLTALFSNITTLQVLDLSRNGFTYLRSNVFTNLKSLQRLHLEYNALDHIGIDLVQVSGLRFLDIAHNRIGRMNYTYFYNQLEKGHKNLTINLSNNPWICDCSALTFLERYQISSIDFEDQQNTVCAFQGVSYRMDRISLKMMRASCRTPLNAWFFIGPAAAFSFAVFLASIAYIQRWKLKWYYYKFRLSIPRRSVKMEPTRSQMYDAFVSYDQNTKCDWVDDELRQRVERQWGLKLYISHRDSVIGDAKLMNLVRAIDSSRKTILLVSRGYVESEWCELELNMAIQHHGQSNVVVCYLEEIPPTDMTKLLRSLIIKRNYLEYTEDALGLELFWLGLREALGGAQVPSGSCRSSSEDSAIHIEYDEQLIWSD